MRERELERTLKALANKRRLAIIRFVKKEKEAAVGDIARAIKLSFKATSRHLNTLFSTDILEREQRNIQVFYRLADELPEYIRRILSILSPNLSEFSYTPHSGE